MAYTRTQKWEIAGVIPAILVLATTEIDTVLMGFSSILYAIGASDMNHILRLTALSLSKIIPSLLSLLGLYLLWRLITAPSDIWRKRNSILLVFLVCCMFLIIATVPSIKISIKSLLTSSNGGAIAALLIFIPFIIVLSRKITRTFELLRLNGNGR